LDAGLGYLISSMGGLGGGSSRAMSQRQYLQLVLGINVKMFHVFDHVFSVLGVSKLKKVRMKCIGSML